MNKNIIFGIAAFGGLLLIGVLLPKTPPAEENGTQQQIVEQEVQTPSLPTTVSAQFPFYPDSTVRNVMENHAEDSDNFSVSLVTSATISEVNVWYAEALSQNGWSIKSDRTVAGYRIIQGEQGNLFTSMQAANGTEPGTVVISQQVKVRK